MFMRYTHFGVGHSAMLRKIIRDCTESVAQNNTMEIENSNDDEDEDLEMVGNNECFDECDDEEDSEEDSEDSDEDSDEDNGEECDELSDRDGEFDDRVSF